MAKTNEPKTTKVPSRTAVGRGVNVDRADVHDLARRRGRRVRSVVARGGWIEQSIASDAFKTSFDADFAAQLRYLV